MKAFLTLTALALLLPFPAMAQYDEYWMHRAFGYDPPVEARPYRGYRQDHNRPRHTRESPRRHWHDDNGRDKLCLTMQRNVGEESPHEAEAKDTAVRAWAALVRFHYGEKYMDLNNAREVRFRCTRSSVFEVMPSERDERYERDDERNGRRDVRPIPQSRCEIEARPCRSASREDERR